MLGLDENGELAYYYKDEEEGAYISSLEKLVNLLQQKDKEIERLNNIINEALGIANERFNYYSNHKNNNEEHLEDWVNIFNILLRRDNK